MEEVQITLEQIIAKANALDDDLIPAREVLKKLRQDVVAKELSQMKEKPNTKPSLLQRFAKRFGFCPVEERDQLQQQMNLLEEHYKLEKESLQKKISSIQRELVFARQKTEDVSHAIEEWTTMKKEAKGGKR